MQYVRSIFWGGLTGSDRGCCFTSQPTMSPFLWLVFFNHWKRCHKNNVHHKLQLKTWRNDMVPVKHERRAMTTLLNGRNIYKWRMKNLIEGKRNTCYSLCVQSGQTRRCLFHRRLWVSQRSDCCSRTIWAPKILRTTSAKRDNSIGVACRIFKWISPSEDRKYL